MLNLFQHLSTSQNLVPNYSFEIYTSCPQTPVKIYLASPWFQPNIGAGNTTNSSSSDLFNSCSTGNVGVPSNAGGFQNARTGNGYAGIYSSFDTSNNAREYIEVPLLSTLIANKKYCVDYYVSLSGLSQIAISNMGAYFSSDSLLQSTIQFYALSSFIPQIENPMGNYLNDTANWILVSGYFIASGGERYMTIGNFLDPSNTHSQSTGFGTQQAAYYYIDDVSVVDCTSGAGVNENKKDDGLEVYPNPSQGTFEIKSENKIKSIVVFNVLGEKIYTEELKDVIIATINLTAMPGVYFVEVKTDGSAGSPQGKIIHKKITIQ